MIMDRMIFVTGFARGGTSWLRDCIASHPGIQQLPNERTIFRDTSSKQKISDYFLSETSGLDESKLIVNKAPANAPVIGSVARLFPESKFIFIVRDPRDVFVSHKRGTKKWMGGANSTVDGCMRKTSKYYKGWLDGQDLDNLLLVRYEDLHQNFNQSMKTVFSFIGVDYDEKMLASIYDANNFLAQTGRQNKEDKDSAKRKGVIGDWVDTLNDKEIQWYEKSSFWQEFMRRHGYDAKPITYENILSAMQEAGVNFLSEDDLLARRLDKGRPNVVLQHDVDYLNKPWCAGSVRKTAEIENKLGVPASYHMLPLDDSRYKWAKSKGVIKLIGDLSTINPKATVGLHLNACEKYYPAKEPDAGKEPQYLPQILEYAVQQVRDYKDKGVVMKIATAHGYGRGKKLPNNRDTPELTEALLNEGVELFDTRIRPVLVEQGSHFSALTDVGGILKPRRLPGGWSLVDPALYKNLPAGSLVRYLTHPGNYPIDKPSALAMRKVNASLPASS